MMRYFTTPAILIFFLSLQVSAQWNWIYPIPQGNTLNEIFFKNSSGLGFAVGRHGAILKTEDMGISWSLKDSVTTRELFSGCFAGEKAFIVGDGGIIFRSNDLNSWDSLESGSHYRLNTIVFPDTLTGYIGGYKGYMIKTTDAGETWQEMISVTLQSIYSGFFFTPEQGIFVGDSGLIIRTGDAGSNWYQPASGTDLALLDVYFPSELVGYITGKKGLILKTTDGGITWTNISFDPMDDELHSVFFWNDTLGYASGAYGRILRTTNGGITWDFFQSGTDLAIRSIKQFHYGGASCDSLIICGDYGLISRTGSCEAWSNITQASNYTFNSLVFTPDGKGFAVGGDPFGDEPFILKTIDPDSSWQAMFVDTITHYLTDVFFLDDTTGYISGRKGNIYKSADGGNNWVPLETNLNQIVYSVSFLAANRGFACGQDGLFIKTTSGDTIWAPISTGTDKDLYALYFIDTINWGYAVGEEGKILRIKNGGYQISSVPSFTTESLYDISFSTANVGFIVGYNGTILKLKRTATTDSIFSIPSGITTPLNKVFFPSPDTGYIAGEGGVILKSTDGGESWNQQYTGTSNSLRGLYFLNDSVGFAAGAGVTVIKTTNGGGEVIIVPGLIETSAEKTLMTIYPNPANELIHVEFQTQEMGRINVGIFDLAGRNIKNFNCYISDSGIQKLSITVSDIETGIYLIVLQTGNKFLSRKLVVY